MLLLHTRRAQTCGIAEMSYASVIVQVDLDSDLAGRVRVAAQVANLFNAHLIGIGAWAPMSLFLTPDGPIDPVPSDFRLQDMKTLLDQKGEQFCAAIGDLGQCAEWRSVLDLPTEVVAREARAADLVIIGSEPETKDPFRRLDPGSLLLKAGRPVLVVPQAVNSLSLKRVAIAWKDTREARRAIMDALPFLQKAGSVVIVEVSDKENAHRGRNHVEDVARYLARHGVAIITEQTRPAEPSVTATLLRMVRDEEINLIVAGAYGHSRLGEWAFGGVTRGLLAESPVCCLFSH
jgi:nucleotide-binding universal stress UspA family protein